MFPERFDDGQLVIVVKEAHNDLPRWWSVAVSWTVGVISTDPMRPFHSAEMMNAKRLWQIDFTEPLEVLGGDRFRQTHQLQIVSVQSVF